MATRTREEWGVRLARVHFKRSRDEALRDAARLREHGEPEAVAVRRVVAVTHTEWEVVPDGD